MQRFVLSAAILALALVAGSPALSAAQERVVRLEIVEAARPALIAPMVERLKARAGSGLSLDETQSRRLDLAGAAMRRATATPTDAQLRAAVLQSVDVAVRGVLPLALPQDAALRLRALAPIRDRGTLDAARIRVTRMRARVTNRRVQAACDAVLTMMTQPIGRSTAVEAASAAGRALADVVASSVAAGAPVQAAFDTVFGPGTVVTGSVSKGPFLSDSSVTVAALDDRGTAIAPAVRTRTINDLGEYAVELPHRGLLSVEARGRAYDELTGEVSSDPLTLRALARASEGAGAMNANVITHICYERTLRLLRRAPGFSAAAARAERELFRELALATPATAGRRMRVDRDDRLLTLSAAIIEAANASGVTVQALMDRLASDLADDGALQPRFRAALLRAQRTIDGAEVRARLDRRFGED